MWLNLYVVGEGGRDEGSWEVEGTAVLFSAQSLSVCPFTCRVDRELDTRKYIVPGIGDFGDR